MDKGWIIIHRKILDSSIYKTDALFKLAMTILLLTNHTDKQWNGITIKRGQVVTGRKKLAEITGQKESGIYKRLKKLEKLGFCNINSNNEYSVISVLKYGQYQDKSNNPSNNEGTTKEQRGNTTKQLNNDNNVTKYIETPKKQMLRFITSVNEKDENYDTLLNQLNNKGIDLNLASSEIDRFVMYWTEPNKSGTKERWELEKTFDVKRRLLNWFRNINKFNKKKGVPKI